jgi:LmbE family N-acetylglucosaminyl deacetylase
MILADKSYQAAAGAAFAGLILAGVLTVRLACQQPVQQPARQPVPAALTLASAPLPEPSEVALPLPEDRGAAALEQSLKRLSTTASLMIIVAHPDDEDGALLTCLSRSMGVRTTLLTLTRGEGGQNAMSADADDALGLLRTNELLRADEFYGAKQLWGTEADFGFSKTQEESFAKWGHDRVLYDAVLAVRRERPQIIVSTFVGGITDGHGHHQVSGEIAQEVFKAAADPEVFPDQLKEYHLQPWQPLAVYSRAPFARIEDGKMFDYATGKWAPARFKNYVTGEWSEGAPSTDVTIQVGTLDPVLGRSPEQIARQGWGQQKSQNGGANPSLIGPLAANYHLWAVAPEAAAKPGTNSSNDDLFHNSKVNIDTSVSGLARLVGRPDVTEDMAETLRQIDASIKQVESKCPCSASLAVAHELAPIYRQLLEFRVAVKESSLDEKAITSLLFELDAKINEFQAAFKELLGLDMIAFRTNSASAQEGGPFRGGSADETLQNVSPGEKFLVRLHATQATPETRLSSVWLQSRSGGVWKAENTTGAIAPTAPVSDPIFRVQVPDNAEPTQPYFTRPSIEQPYYDLTHPEWRLRSFAPYPLAAWAEFTFDGLPIRIGEVVQTIARIPGVGGVYEPLVVTPAIGVRMEPEARILPLDGSALPVRVTVHAQAAAEGTVELELQAGWKAEPASVPFHLGAAADSEPIQFLVNPSPNSGSQAGLYVIQAVARTTPRPGDIPVVCPLDPGPCPSYETGWQSIGYPGLRPYNQYKLAQLKTRKVDVKLAAGLRIGYVMGTGDLVPEAIKGLGSSAHLLTASELASGDLSAWNVIVIGIRAYSARPELISAQPRLDEFVRRGGTLIVQYQTGNFPAPFPLSMSRMAERVVDETAPVKLLDPSHPLFNWPNVITAADFDGWVEERGHSFLDSWGAHYTPLTETADPGQDAQRGGLLVAHPGKGTYIYVAYALHRQLPELVPGAYRLLANLLSAGQDEPARGEQSPAPSP